MSDTITISKELFESLVQQVAEQTAMLKKLTAPPPVPVKVIRHRESREKIVSGLTAKFKKQGYFTVTDLQKAATVVSSMKFPPLKFLLQTNRLL